MRILPLPLFLSSFLQVIKQPPLQGLERRSWQIRERNVWCICKFFPFFSKPSSCCIAWLMVTQKQGLRWDGETRQGYKSCGCISQHVTADWREASAMFQIIKVGPALTAAWQHNLLPISHASLRLAPHHHAWVAWQSSPKPPARSSSSSRNDQTACSPVRVVHNGATLGPTVVVLPPAGCGTEND